MPRSRRVTFGVILVLIVSGVTLASAQWLATGTGSGTAQAITMEVVAITGLDGEPDLYPGFTEGDVHFTLTNPNVFAIQFTDMVSGAVTSSDPTNCPAGNVTVEPTATGLDVVVPAGPGGTVDAAIADVVSMDAAAPNGCQGVSFSIDLTLTGEQVP